MSYQNLDSLFLTTNSSDNKQSVVVNDDSLKAMSLQKPEFTQWIGDNVDHNVSTLDGKNTFHGMGIIAASINSVLCPHKDSTRTAKKGQ